MLNAIAVIMVRILAAYVLFQALAGLAMVAGFSFSAETDEAARLAMIATVVIYSTGFVVGTLLWAFSRRMARRISEGLADQQQTINAEDLVAAGSFLIGLFWFATGVPDVLSSLYSYFSLFRQGFPVQFGGGLLISSLASMLLGLLIMVGHRRIVCLFRFIRRAG
jgi:hypothetical protein